MDDHKHLGVRSLEEMSGSYSIYVNTKEFFPGGSVCSQTFQLGGCGWCFEVEHTEGGYLSAYLHSISQHAMGVHYSVTVVNQVDEQEHIVNASGRLFSPMDSWGFRQLASMQNLMNPGQGFLSGNVLTVRLDMRLSQPKEMWQTKPAITASDKSAIFIWRLDDVHGKLPWRRSQEFDVGGYKWVLCLYPDEQGLAGEYVCAGIQCLSHSSINAKCRLLATSHSPTEYACEEHLAAQVFSSPDAVSGHHKLLRFCNLNVKKQESIEKDSVFSLIVYISIQDDKHGASMKNEE